MIGRRRGETEPDTDDEAAIWATDTIPVDDEPTEFDWSSSRAEEPTGDRDASTQPSRLRTIVGAGIATAILLVIAVLVWPRSEDPVDETADDVDSVPATLDTLPDTQTTVPDEASDAESSDEPSTTENTFDVDEPDDVGEPIGTGDLLDTPRQVAVDADEVTQIEVPPALAALTQPTELLMITDRQLVTVSLPSGRVRRSSLPGFLGGQIVVSPSSAFVAGGASSYVISRDGEIREVDPDVDGLQDSFVQGWIESADGSVLFVVNTFGERGQSGAMLVAEDGSVETEPDIPLPSFTSLFDFVRSDGNRIANDAGGVYRFGADGTVERIAEGRAFSATDDAILLRECSESLDCSLVVADLVGDERRVVDDRLVNVDNPATLDLAPDGNAITWQDSGDAGRVLVDLETGETWTAPPTFSFAASTNWSADSSGVFDIAQGGLQFFERSSGEIVEFGDELQRVSSLAVRHVEAELPPFPLTDAGGDEGNLRLDQPLPIPSGLELLVLGRGERMAHVDIDNESGTPWMVPQLVGSASPEMFANGPNVTVLGAAVGVGFVSTFGSAASIDLANSPVELPPSPRFPGPFPGTVWAPRTSTSTGVDHRLYVVDRALPAIDGADVVIPGATLLGGEGSGRLVVEAGGDIFVVDGSTTERLTSGELLAIGPSVALVRECDSSLRCAVISVQRGTGQQTPLNDATLATAAAATADRTAPVAATVAPDGSAMIVEVPVSISPSRWAFVDLRSQETVAIPEPAERQPIVWNPSGSHVAYAANGELHVYDRANAAVSTVRGLGEVRAITVSPDGFTAAGNN